MTSEPSTSRPTLIAPDDLPRNVVSFIEDFYKVSDTPHADEAYADLFSSDGSAKVFGITHQGREGLLAWRSTAWVKVVRREHLPLKIYSCGPDDLAVICTAKLWFADGKEDSAAFMGLFNLKPEGGKVTAFAYETVILKK